MLKIKKNYHQIFFIQIKFNKKGFFAEIGYKNPVYSSNSYFLDKHYKYTCISIDATDFKKKFKKLSP